MSITCNFYYMCHLITKFTKAIPCLIIQNSQLDSYPVLKKLALLFRLCFWHVFVYVQIMVGPFISRTPVGMFTSCEHFNFRHFSMEITEVLRKMYILNILTSGISRWKSERFCEKCIKPYRWKSYVFMYWVNEGTEHFGVNWASWCL